MGHRLQQWVVVGYRIDEDKFKTLPKIKSEEYPSEYIEQFNVSFNNGEGKFGIQLCFTDRAGKGDIVVGRCLSKSGYADALYESTSLSLNKATELKPYIDGLLEAVFGYNFCEEDYGFHFVSDMF